MQKLSLHSYVHFCEQMLMFRKSGVISQSIFEKSVLPGYSWSTELQENYMDTRVRALLKEIKSSGLLKGKSGDGNSVEYIDSILSGKAAENVKQLRAAGQIP